MVCIDIKLISVLSCINIIIKHGRRKLPPEPVEAEVLEARKRRELGRIESYQKLSREFLDSVRDDTFSRMNR